MADVTNEHNIRHHVEGLVRAAVKAIARIPRKETRAEVRAYITTLRENTEIAIADGRTLDAASLLADFGRRALFWTTQDLAPAADYTDEEATSDDALLAESEINREPRPATP